jgi:transmembrane 9 superfamily member 2/4
MNNETCQFLCKSTVPAEDAKFINQRIRENYAINWLIDGLPAASKKTDAKTHTPFYSIGFELGDPTVTSPEPPLNNHYDITIQYHPQDKGKYRVVGVIVKPFRYKDLI